MESGAKESSDNKTAKVIESTDETEHPWNALETVTTFDRGIHIHTCMYKQIWKYRKVKLNAVLC